jgi:carbonic anhydrase
MNFSLVFKKGNWGSKLSVLNCSAMLMLLCLPLGGADSVRVVDAGEALATLKRGNERITSQELTSQKPIAARIKDTSASQHPIAIVIACSDSRSSPELIFDQTIGDLFVVRTAGNLVDEYALGSIEYAVNYLGVRLIVVMGHTHCGAVSAAVGSPTASGNIQSLVRDIQPAVIATRDGDGNHIEAAIKENAHLVAGKISQAAEFSESVSGLKILTALHDLETGKVHWIDL